MSQLLPVASWGLRVSPNEGPESAFGIDPEPATLRITMAALDPGENIADNEGVSEFKKPRATLKMVVMRADDSDDSEDDEDMDMDDALGSDDSDEENENGEGPSDPKKSSKAMKKAALKKAVEENSKDVLATNGIAKAKGKGKATEDVDMDDDEDEEDEDDEDMFGGPLGTEEYVLCTLEPESHFNQPLNITIPGNEYVAFQVEGTHTIHLTGNILADPNEEPPFGSETSEDEDEDVDLTPDEDELEMPNESESDELDDMEDPRIKELDSDDEEEQAPKLVKAKKEDKPATSGVKRPHPEETGAAAPKEYKKPSLDDIKIHVLGKHPITDEDLPRDETGRAITPPEYKKSEDKPLSKSQQKKMRKKMKDNNGNAVEVKQATSGTDEGEKVTPDVKKDAPNGKAKQVQFADKLVQGPTVNGTSTNGAKANGKTGVTNVKGVVIDDRKKGSGPQVKNGDRVALRYIGKLEKDKKQFDANKKGEPFKFKVGSGQVISGWEIGVQGMQAGGERRITVPADQAYGSKKNGDIPANSTLIFDLKLLSVN